MSTPFRELEVASLAAMTTDERARFDAALEEEEARRAMAEMVYQQQPSVARRLVELLGEFDRLLTRTP